MTIGAFLKVLFVALSLGLDVFAVSVGVGMKGTDRAVKIRIGLAFALAEVSMTVIGVLIGQAAGKLLGDTAGYLGFAALVGVGGYMIYEALHGTEEGGGFDLSRGWGLTLGALSASLHNVISYGPFARIVLISVQISGSSSATRTRQDISLVFQLSDPSPTERVKRAC